MVRSFSVGSSGTVAATGTVGAQSISANASATSLNFGTISNRVPGTNATNVGWSTGTIVSGQVATGFGFAQPLDAVGNSQNWASYSLGTGTILPGPARTWPIQAQSIPGNISSTNITGGSTNLTSAEFGIYLVDSTTITATGACRWEVIEFN